MALTIDGSDPTGDLGDLLDDKLAVATAVSDYLPIAGGKVLQIVRATDATERTTTSTSFVDASLSVTITPQKNNSAILLISANYATAASNDLAITAITDSSNNFISGAETVVSGDLAGTSLQNTVGIAYATPATTSATTYKLRFRSNSGGVATLGNSVNTGQLYAIEVSA